MPERVRKADRVAEVFAAFLRLGCTSFGGPAAHLGYFQAEFVERRRWVTAAEFAELVALSQALPGPGSSQVGFAIGLTRAGWLGGLAAFAGFTTPSAVLMLAFAFGYSLFGGRVGAGVLQGLELAAVAVVAQAVLAMQRTLAPDALRVVIAAAAVPVVLLGSAGWGTPLAIALGALAGLVLLRKVRMPELPDGRIALSRKVSGAVGGVCAALFVVSLVVRVGAPTAAALAAVFYRAGSLVFGGGHVVLPLLSPMVVGRGWLSESRFLAGYGAAQALPGPVFPFAAYVGASARMGDHPLACGVLSVLALYAPGLMLMGAALPFWQGLRGSRVFRAALAGINAAVVGVLAAALVRPIASSTLHGAVDVVLTVVAFVAVWRFRLAPWMVVLGMGFAGLLRAVI